MSKKSNYNYQCSNCGQLSAKWEGKCSQCAAWNSFQEFVAPSGGTVKGRKREGVTLSSIRDEKSRRLSSGISQFDNLLGGGFVTGSVLLVAGQPGIGKSTLLMQLAGNTASADEVLYVSAEESLSQVASRAKRLGLKSRSKLNLLDSSSAEDIATTIREGGFHLAVVDSIQTISSQLSTSAAGSPSQVNLAGQMLIKAAKASGTILVIVGHVTKEGSIAGPKVLEHLVDVVLNIEGDRFSTLRVMRSQKNRYGPTDELILMDMTAKGLEVVLSPSKELLRERQRSDGSVVLAALDGNQPLLVEVQALVNPTSFGYPKRSAVGFDINRLNLLVAMLSRRTKLDLSGDDIYVNIVGGFRLNDPGADLAVCMAIATAAKGMQLRDDGAVFGEVGLSGELRHVPGAEKRIKEAKSMGIKRIIGPKVSSLSDPIYHPEKTVKDTLNNNLGKN